MSIYSHLTNEERVALYNLADGAQAIVEIGSYLGASACCFGAALKKQGSGRVYCIDTWTNDGMLEGHRDTFAAFKTNVAPFEAYVTSVRGYSTQVVSAIREYTNQVDVLFIDGDHSYEGVKADWDAYKAFLRDGSKIVFHDWGWAEGVQRVIDEDVKRTIKNADHLPNLWWGTIDGTERV
ncbi:MAG: class I SAM-dependent methyltransferase [Alphaproteobacteria bacterium]|nr:class I SAM-dependent methyltransferase [Alphaproteobacteria bacterium]